MAQWTVLMEVVHHTTVTVEAESLQEAEEMAMDCEWVDDGMLGADLVDWDLLSKPKEEK